MEAITVNKEQLLATITTNRDAHRDQFLTAQKRYREVVIGELDKRLESAQRGGPINLGFALPEPRDYTDSYDTAIQMLQWELEDTVTLDEHSFRQFVLNKWEWASQFAGSTQVYLQG